MTDYTAPAATDADDNGEVAKDNKPNEYTRRMVRLPNRLWAKLEHEVAELGGTVHEDYVIAEALDNHF